MTNVSLPKDLGPGVKFPPPILFVAGFAIGALISRAQPVPAPWGNATWVTVCGLLLLIAGITLMAVGVATFRRAKVSVYPNRPARHLVTHGVYARTRNPMYVGLTIAYLGGVLATGLMIPLLCLPVVLWLLVQLVVKREERHLTETFPAEYAEYCARVRRWV